MSLLTGALLVLTGALILIQISIELVPMKLLSSLFCIIIVHEPRSGEAIFIVAILNPRKTVMFS